MSVGLCKKCIFTAEIVDLFFISRAHKLYMGGNIVGVVDLYFISRARVMCGREILLERLIYILYHEREIYMGGKYCWGVDLYFVSCSRELCMGGNIVEAVEDLKMHFYGAAVLIDGRGIFLGC